MAIKTHNLYSLETAAGLDGQRAFTGSNNTRPASCGGGFYVPIGKSFQPGFTAWVERW